MSRVVIRARMILDKIVPALENVFFLAAGMVKR
jgi:hypothetical protein